MIGYMQPVADVGAIAIDRQRLALQREEWWRDVASGAYQAWIDKNYGYRIAV